LFFLSLSTKLIDPISEGLATRSEVDNLNAWEAQVEFAFLGRVTWDGHRELLYYVSGQQPTAEGLGALSGTRPFVFICDRDQK
jgi:hypothetical protein